MTFTLSVSETIFPVCPTTGKWFNTNQSRIIKPIWRCGGILTVYSVCMCARFCVCRLTDARLQANLIRRRRRHLSGSLNKSAFSRDFSNIALPHVQRKGAISSLLPLLEEKIINTNAIWCWAVVSLQKAVRTCQLHLAKCRLRHNLTFGDFYFNILRIFNLISPGELFNQHLNKHCGRCTWRQEPRLSVWRLGLKGETVTSAVTDHHPTTAVFPPVHLTTKGSNAQSCSCRYHRGSFARLLALPSWRYDKNFPGRPIVISQSSLLSLSSSSTTPVQSLLPDEALDVRGVDSGDSAGVDCVMWMLLEGS